MSILDEIVSWSSELPTWQADVVRRLFLQHELSEEDLQEVMATMKVQYGFENPSALDAIPLSQDHIPQAQRGAGANALLRVRDLKNVNAIASGTTLEFGAQGITVIYGDNGSGKSGYARMFKNACRSRDNEPVLPDLSTMPVTGEAAESIFTIDKNGVETDLPWKEDEASPIELSTVAIFDAKCARLYLDKEDDYAFVPYGLDIFPRLVGVVQALKEKITAEGTAIDVDMTVFSDIQTLNPAISTILSRIGVDLTRVEAENAASFSLEQDQRLSELEKYLSESDPSNRLVELKQTRSRLNSYKQKVSLVERKFASEKVNSVKHLSEAYWVTKEASELAKNNFVSGDNLLNGTGGEAWKALFESSRAFCIESHSHCEFPEFHDSDPCPLCQQPLTADAIGRMKRFDDFLGADAERNLISARQNLNAEYVQMLKLPVDFQLEEAVLNEIEALQPSLKAKVIQQQEELEAYRVSIETVVKSRDWGILSSAPSTIVPDFENIEAALNADIDALTVAANNEQRQYMVVEFNSLKGHKTLSERKELFLRKYDNFQVIKKLRLALSGLDHAAISRKATQISQTYISTELQNTLNNEFQGLRLDKAKVKLKSRSVGGKTLHKLILDLPQNSKIGDVLSDGEQRAISIASFLAEVCIQQHNGTIVFDDPVSSLDHKNRDAIAKRLVSEASSRQVVIFSHDLYFINLLISFANTSGIDIATRRLSRTAQGYGVPSEHLPFQGQNTKQRIGKLKSDHQRIAAIHNRNEEESYKLTREAYRDLRDTWERAVEEVLFNGVVQRFNLGISTQRLNTVAVEDSDFQVINEGMAKASNFSHDNAQTIGIVVPLPDELLEDIQSLETWRSEVVGRGSTIRGRRK